MSELHKPHIESIEKVATSRLFTIESVSLSFANGARRSYERLAPTRGHAVMVVPMLDEATFLLVREYSVGVEDYTLSFPKGLIEQHENLYEGAERELSEEIGKAAREYRTLTSLMMSPNYMTHTITVVLAYDLYDKTLEGDEPEPLTAESWHLGHIDTLLGRSDFLESRSITALLMIWKNWVQGRALDTSSG